MHHKDRINYIQHWTMSILGPALGFTSSCANRQMLVFPAQRWPSLFAGARSRTA